MKKLFATLVSSALLVGLMALPAAADEGNFVDFIGDAAEGGRYEIIGDTVLALAGSGDLTDGDLAALGSAELTAFLPTDVAFRRLVADLDPDVRFWWQVRESEVIPFLVDALGLATIAEVVKYHIYAGGKVDYRTALSLDDDRRNGTSTFIEMYNGGDLGIDRRGFALQLDDTGAALGVSNNPFVVQRNIDAGNAIVHGIGEVLLP
jgi:uncharacterized surface protein with fasciclin (FAS1) repeats